MIESRARFRPSRAVIAGATAAGILLPGSPAGATPHSVQTLANGAHVLLGSADETEVGSGLEHWTNFRTQETTPVWDTVCNYQSNLTEIAPDGQTIIFDEFSSRHQGCTLLIGFFDWPNWDANYREDTRFRCKWRSDATVGGDWQRIGDLRD